MDERLNGIMRSLPLRLREHARRWGVPIDEIPETESSWIAYGRRRELPVVLKVLKRPGGEWRSGEILVAFEGRGAARVYEHVEDAAFIAARLRQIGLQRILYGPDLGLGSNLPPRQAWGAFRGMLPLMEAELRTIAENVAPYMR